MYTNTSTRDRHIITFGINVCTRVCKIIQGYKSLAGKLFNAHFSIVL